MFFCQPGVGIFDNAVGGFAGGKHFQNKIHHDAGTFETGFAVADLGINRDVFIDVHSESIAEQKRLSTWRFYM